MAVGTDYVIRIWFKMCVFSESCSNIAMKAFHRLPLNLTFCYIQLWIFLMEGNMSP